MKKFLSGRLMVRTYWFAVFALLILALCAMPSPVQADEPDKIDPEKYAVGARLAKGIKKAEACEFSQLSF